MSNQSEDLLKPLPLVFTHGDINGLNILTNGDGEISGVMSRGRCGCAGYFLGLALDIYP